MKSEIMKKAEELGDYLVSTKRHIHQDPELGMHEFKTAALVREELTKMGIEIVPLGTDIGVLGIIRGEKEGSDTVTALRADMDAMPIQEETGLPDESRNPGVMHACGHDCHTTMLLGAARLLNSMRDRFSGTVKLIFQPGEETLKGSAHMIEKGVLDNPRVDTVLALHGISDHDAGKVALWKGPYMASSDFFTVRVIGKGGHGAYPHKTPSDAVLAAANAVMALQSVVTRQINAIDSVVLSVCTIHGGDAKNAIPAEVTFAGSIRCQNPKVRDTMEERMNGVIAGVVSAYGCTHEMDYQYGVPPLVNDPDVVDMVAEAVKKVVGEENLEKIAYPAMGSEDFSRYLENVPHGVFARLGINIPGRERPMHHNGHFVFPEEVLPVGVALFTQFILDNNQ